MLFAFMLACSEPADSGEEPALCADAPTVTWETFGEALLVENCQSCHASTSESRNGAPEAVTFDTYEDAMTWGESILRTTDPAARTMPPGIALADADRERLEIWLRCWE